MNKKLEEMLLDKYRKQCVDFWEERKTDEEIDLMVAGFKYYLRAEGCISFVQAYSKLCKLTIIRDGVGDRDEQIRLWNLYHDYLLACDGVVNLALKSLLKEVEQNEGEGVCEE